MSYEGAKAGEKRTFYCLQSYNRYRESINLRPMDQEEWDRRRKDAAEVERREFELKRALFGE